MSHTWKLGFKPKGSVITVSLGFLDQVEVLGSTCPVTLRPGQRTRSSTFRILPGEGERNLVLVKLEGGHEGGTRLIHVLKNGDKTTAHEDPEDPDHTVGAEKDYQIFDGYIELLSEGTLFTSGVAARSAPKTRSADPSDILRFIAGRLDHRQLVRASNAWAREKSLSARNRELTQEVAALHRQLREVADSASRITRIVESN